MVSKYIKVLREGQHWRFNKLFGTDNPSVDGALTPFQFPTYERLKMK